MIESHVDESISESDSVVDESLRLMIKDYFHTTYSAGSHSESDSLYVISFISNDVTHLRMRMG